MANQHKKYFQRIINPSITDEVINQILNAIQDDVFTPGVRLPSEPNLADQLGVSRNTLREALNTLIEKGYLYRQRGVGTFVTPQSAVMLRTSLSSVTSCSVMIANQKKQPAQKDFSFKLEYPSKQVAEKLQLSKTDQVMHVSRVRTADGLPVILSDEYFSSQIDGLDYELAEYAKLKNWSIYDYFQKADYSIQSVITHVHAITADAKMAQSLDIEENSKILCLEEVHFSNSYIKPLLFCLSYLNDKMISIMLVRSL